MAELEPLSTSARNYSTETSFALGTGIVPAANRLGEDEKALLKNREAAWALRDTTHAATLLGIAGNE